MSYKYKGERGRKTDWAAETEAIKEKVEKGISLKKIGAEYGVSSQRMYQVLNKYGIQTPIRKRKNFLKGKGIEFYWLNKILTTKGVKGLDKNKALEEVATPEYCPCLGIKLNYNGTGEMGYTRTDNSPSLDRIDSSKGYECGNIQVISWRANRIKNDSTLEELELIVKHLQSLIK